MKKILYLGLELPEALAHFGSDRVIHCPLIQIMPRPPSLPDIRMAFQYLPSYTHLVFTSKSAVKILFDYLVDFNFTVNDLTGKQCLAVGESTAKEICRQGLTVSAVAQEETAEGLVEVVEKLPISDQAFFFGPALPLLVRFFLIF